MSSLLKDHCLTELQSSEKLRFTPEKKIPLRHKQCSWRIIDRGFFLRISKQICPFSSSYCQDMFLFNLPIRGGFSQYHSAGIECKVNTFMVYPSIFLSFGSFSSFVVKSIVQRYPHLHYFQILCMSFLTTYSAYGVELSFGEEKSMTG